MIVPNSFKNNLNQNIITEDMLEAALYSVNKRAKNYRDKKRDSIKYCNSKKYKNYLQNKETEMYLKKLTLLTLLKPVCIHKEFLKNKTTRVYNKNISQIDYLNKIKQLDNKIVNFGYYYTPGHEKIDFFDWEDKTKPIYNYYLFYQTKNYSYHTPIDESQIEFYKSLYNISIMNINKLDTHGDKNKNLLPMNLVNQMVDIINSKNFIFIKKY